MAEKIREGKVRCSFCQKTEDQVRKLIAGPDGAYICDECVGICSEIMEEEFGGYDQEDILGSEINLMKPEEIHAILDDYVIGQDEAKKALSDRKSTRLNSSHITISYAVFCLKKNFFNDTATTEIYTLSLHDALPI